ncbi:hypothetical protein E4U53_005392 [Claviceps sorghi]|nr:hypothetical protein E4U53_005392 [Claviceps sorghi]
MEIKGKKGACQLCRRSTRYRRAVRPFWVLRLDPTSAAAAYVNLARRDPCRPPGPGRRTSRRGAPDAKHWCEALTTTLEEASPRRNPHDGLVALLTPAAAAGMAAQGRHDAASNEGACLVWDDDAATHYLVHNALARPFVVATQRNPAYSRVAHTLEHDECPAPIAKLTRAGTSGGWLELDTRVASLIPACYILDVVVAALLLVAAREDRARPSASLATFAPPPTPPPVAAVRGARRGSWSSRWGAVLRTDRTTGRTRRDRGQRRRSKTEEFEMDLESHNGSLAKERRGSRCPRDEGPKLPLLVRIVVKLTKGLFALVLCILTALFKCLAGVLKVLYKCVGSKY